jgi:hypothetical protein
MSPLPLRSSRSIKSISIRFLPNGIVEVVIDYW